MRSRLSHIRPFIYSTLFTPETRESRLTRRAHVNKRAFVECVPPNSSSLTQVPVLLQWVAMMGCHGVLPWLQIETGSKHDVPLHTADTCKHSMSPIRKHDSMFHLYFILN